MPPIYFGVWAALKAADPVNSVPVVAAMAQACAWRPECIARFCALLDFDPREAAAIIAQARASADLGQPWFQPA